MAMGAAPMPPPPPAVAGPPPQDAAPPNAAPQPLVSRPPQAAQAQSANGQDLAQAFMQQVAELHTGIKDLAGQYPEFKPFAADAMEALKQGMVAVVGSLQRGPEVASPNLHA